MTGPLLNVTKAEAKQAELDNWKRRRFLVKHFLAVDPSKITNPADQAMADRVMAAARDDFAEFENLLTFPEVNALFNSGAIHPHRPLPEASARPTATPPKKAPRK